MSTTIDVSPAVNITNTGDGYYERDPISLGAGGTDPLTDYVGFVIDVEAGSSNNFITNNTITNSDVALVDTNGANDNTFTGNILNGNIIGAWIGQYADSMYPPNVAPTGRRALRLEEAREAIS